jgi:hypothetical protein
MDMSFARRGSVFKPKTSARIDLKALLADLSARQSDSITARFSSKMDGSQKNFSAFDPKAATFAPQPQEHKARNSGSFSDVVADLITLQKGS